MGQVWRTLRRAWWLPVAVPAALTAAAWLIQTLISDSLPSWVKTALIVSGTLSTLLAVVLPARKISYERRAREDTEASYKTKVNDILVPVTEKVNEIVAATTAVAQKEAQDTLRQMVVGFASNYRAGDRACARLYILSEIEGHPDQKKLTLKNWNGGDTRPVETFDENTTLGRLLLRYATRHESKLIPDVRNERIADWDAPDCPYRSFLCAPVHAGALSYGLLTLDSRKVNDFTTEDLVFIGILAQLLASGLSATPPAEIP